MNIRYYRGDDHEIRFKFKSFTGKIDDVHFIVKDLNKSIKIEKKVGNGINLIDGWYHIIFKPQDTINLDDSKMIYDIRVIIDGLIYTVKRGYFKLK